MNLVDVELTDKELSLLLDSELLPLKRRVCEKVEQILLILQKKLLDTINQSGDQLPSEIATSSGKITRGENYRSYAYRVLDCPAYFEKENLLIYRTVVLWAHRTGFHLILSGDYLQRYKQSIKDLIWDIPEGWYISDSDTPWEWIPEEKEHVSINKRNSHKISEILEEKTFIKLSYYLPLEKYSEIPSVGLEQWQFWQQELFQKK